MTKHTPGPWHVEIGQAACFHDGNRASIVHSFRDNGEVIYRTIAEVWPGSEDIDLVDARLIAAAPDLLAALKDLLPVWECGIKEPWVEAARVAIAKATAE